MSVLDPPSGSRALTIAADPARLHTARDWARRVAVDAGLDEASTYQVRLAVSEAVSNAILHGSNDSDDRIEIAAIERPDALVFEVRDNGTFDLPIRETSLEDEGGRGLELLALMMDEVHIGTSPNGSLLRFVKRL